MSGRDSFGIWVLGLLLCACSGGENVPSGSAGSAGNVSSASAGAGGLALNLAPPAQGSDQYLQTCARFGLGGVQSVTLSPDGATVLVGGFDLAVSYARETGELLRRYPVEGLVRSAAFSPDGQTLAVATATRAALFEVGTAALMTTLEGSSADSSEPLAVAFSPDGAHFAIADGMRIRLYSRPELTPIRDLEVPTLSGSSDRMTFAPDTSELLVRTARGVDAIDINSGTATQLFAMPASFYGALAASAVGLIAASDDRGNISVWQRGQAEPLFHKSDTASRNTLTLSQDGTRLATLAGSQGSDLYVWDVPSGAEQLHQVLDGFEANSADFYASARISPDGTQVFANDTFRVRSFAITVRQETAGYSWGNVGDFSAGALSPDQRLLATSARDAIFVWDRSSERIVSTLTPMATGHVTFSSNSQRLYSSRAGTVYEWDPETGSLLRQSAQLSRSDVGPLIASPDGKWLLADVLSDEDPVLISTETLVPTLRIPAWGAQNAVFSPDSKSFVAALAREEIGVWDTNSGALKTSVNVQGEIANTFFAAGGTRLVVAVSTDGLVFAWPELTLLQRLQRHTAVISLRPIGDDQHVLSWGGDMGRIVLWDILTGQALSEGATDADYVPRIGLPAGMAVSVLGPRGNGFRIYCSRAAPTAPIADFGVPR